MVRKSTHFTALAFALMATALVQGSMLAGFDSLAEQGSSTQASAATTATAVVELPRVEVTYVRG
jgi:hypothetical protein